MNAPQLSSDIDALTEVFRAAERPRSTWLVGMESEKFGVFADGSPLAYSGERSVQTLFEGLMARGFTPGSEVPDGPVIYLTRGQQNVTLEPGAQVELSGSPLPDVHQVAAEYHEHLDELEALGRPLGLNWLHTGFHPFARLEQLPWVPKERYGVMRKYLPTRGARALDMMQRTATVQVNLDYESEADAMRKLMVLLKVTPFLQALLVNAPFIEGRQSPLLSERLDVWQHMDPARSGLLAPLWDLEKPRYSDYVQWALDAGMFMLRRPSGNVVNAGQTFRDFLLHGFDGQRATDADWRIHLGSLFPEVRLKTTLEVRGFDAMPAPFSLGIPALLVGLAYDPIALDAAWELVAELTVPEAVQLQHSVARHGLDASWHGSPVGAVVQQLLSFARGGLERRSRLNNAGEDETCFLEPLEELAQSGRSLAQAILLAIGNDPAQLLDRGKPMFHTAAVAQGATP